jgi:pyrimidine deaminase RibD-like protein
MLIVPEDQDQDIVFMKLAIEEAKKSKPVDSAYCVGALLVAPIQGASAEDLASSNPPVEVIASGYSRQLPGNTHAEECALQQLADKGRAKGSTCYTTMEPCSTSLSGNTPCTERIIDAGVKRVVIGALEPDHFVECKGISLLEQANISVRVLKGLEAECLSTNAHILKKD